MRETVKNLSVLLFALFVIGQLVGLYVFHQFWIWTAAGLGASLGMFVVTYQEGTA